MSDFAHGGHVRHLAESSGIPLDRLLDFSANINPLGPPEWMRAVISASLGSVIHYPDPECRGLKAAAGRRYDVPEDAILVGNGSTELIYSLPRVLGRKSAVVPIPAYLDYARACAHAGMEVSTVGMTDATDFSLDLNELESRLNGGELVFLGHPNNPTGIPVDEESFLALAARYHDTIFIVDEAFVDLAEGLPSFVSSGLHNVIVLISLTKTYAIPGLRLGIAVANEEIVKKAEELQPPWSVNSIAQAIGTAALDDLDYIDRSRRFVSEMRTTMETQLRQIPGITVYPGRANYLLVRLDRDDVDAHELASRMLDDGIAIRVCANFQGLDHRFFRVAVRTGQENVKLLNSLRNALGVKRPGVRESAARTIMVQGTGSNAGKSVLTAALCRILLQDGHRVAPFKSQNMSLNSFVTRDGGEMGRAQVVQAQACRMEPDVRMNPILLKPTTDVGSQVIVMGKPVGNMEVAEYVRFKPKAFRTACRAFEELSSENDIIVMEGAGSPGEVNLKHHDIVNMRMAWYADAPVLLVGDIDRGGVFASFVGTMEVLAEWERKLVKGFIVNRFRGRADLLDDAFRYTRLHTGVPVLGTVPFLTDLGLPEEDSVTFKSGFFDETYPGEDHVEIGIVDLPHISNFTDFDALRIEPDVRVRVVRSVDELNQPDAVILPGSKNVPGDMNYLKEQGLDRRIVELTRSGRTELVGVCGGFQMIGEHIADPHHMESAGASIPGLGLLKLTTVMEPEKTLTRVDAKHIESGHTVYGYEIHHGQTDSTDVDPVLIDDNGRSSGARSPDGRIWGSYIHGIFDADGFRRWFVDRLRVRRGLQAKGKICGTYDLEPAFDRLAQVVRDSLQMDRIYRLLGL